MPTVITETEATEKSTFVITVSFVDDAGEAVTPDTMKWSLVDKNNVIINEREDMVLSGLASEMDIVLSGDDLEILAGKSKEKRFLVMEGTYSSSAGLGLPLKDQLSFILFNLKKVT